MDRKLVWVRYGIYQVTYEADHHVADPLSGFTHEPPCRQDDLWVCTQSLELFDFTKETRGSEFQLSPI